MKSFFRSVVFGFAVVFVLGVSSLSAASAVKAPIKNAVIDLVADSLDGDLSAKDVAKAAVHYGAGVAATPAAVAGASALGATASTGTAISTLSGAAAVSATSAAIGAPVSAALSAVGIAVAPAVVGGVIILGTATAIAYGFNALFLDDD